MENMNNTLQKMFSKPNPNYEEQVAKKKQAEDDYSFLLNYQGLTSEYDDLLEQFRIEIDNWSIATRNYVVNAEDRKLLTDKITHLIAILEENTNFHLR